MLAIRFQTFSPSRHRPLLLTSPSPLSLSIPSPPTRRRARSRGSDVLLSRFGYILHKTPLSCSSVPPYRPSRLQQDHEACSIDLCQCLHLPLPAPPLSTPLAGLEISRDARRTSAAALYAAAKPDSCPPSLVLPCAHCAIRGSYQHFTDTVHHLLKETHTCNCQPWNRHIPVLGDSPLRSR